MKRWMAMVGTAIALGTGGSWLVAGPALANDPPVEGTCPMFTGADHAFDNGNELPAQGTGHMGVACKRIGGNG